MNEEDPQPLSNGFSSERGPGWLSGRTQTSTTPVNSGMSSASKDWLSFLFMTLGKAIPLGVHFPYILNLFIVRLVPPSLFHYRILES